MDPNNSNESVALNGLSIFTPLQSHLCSETCIHTVAKSGDDSKLLSALKSMNGDGEASNEINQTDENKRTALHLVNIIECRCGKCLDGAESCTKSLLSHDKVDVDVQDAVGCTPLHLALQHGSSKAAKLLVAYGAKISIKNNNDETPLNLMALKCPEVMVTVLDNAVSVEDFYPNSEKCVLRLDLGTVIGYPGPTPPGTFQRELRLLSSSLHGTKRSKQMILTHPLVLLFLDQKWRRVRKYFATLFFCYLFWLLAYTSYIIKVYLVSCPCEYFTKKNGGNVAGATASADKNEFGLLEDEIGNRCHLETGFTFDAFVVILLTGIMAANEILKLVTVPWLYLKYKLNIGSWILIFMVFLSIGPIIMEKNSKLEAWQYQTASLSIFLSWAFILAQLGSFPSLGRYVEILGHVLKNFGLSMLTFSSLFMAFAISFNVLFPGKDHPFSHFFYAILKCIVMFTGEVDYQDTFYDKERESTTGPVVGHILYSAFVLIVTIVLMNLLVGLTVRDIQVLEKEAELTRVLRQITELLRLEAICFANKLPGPVNRFMQRQISVTGHKSYGKESLVLRIRPNDPSEKLVPENLKAAMLQLAIRSYHAQKKPMKNSATGQTSPKKQK